MILLTGAAGFIGQNLLKKLTIKNNKIILVDDLSNKIKSDLLSKYQSEYIYDYRDLLKILKSYKFDIQTIFHMGANSDTTCKDKNLIDEQNFKFTINLFNFFKFTDCKFIYASSASVYGTNKNFLEVIENENPINLYSISKLNIDNYIRLDTDNFKKNICSIYGLRYFNVYGPGENLKGRMASVIYQFFNQAKQFNKIKLFKGTDGYKDGEQLRDFIYIDDIIKINMWFADNSFTSGIYNVGTGQARSFNFIAEVVKDWFIIKGHNCTIEYIDFPEDLIKSYQNYTCADISNLIKIGYKTSFINLKIGINNYLSILDK
jgi:ADP-L-glycero-D-manno-heptose 6-epimerase